MSVLGVLLFWAGAFGAGALVSGYSARDDFRTRRVADHRWLPFGIGTPWAKTWTVCEASGIGG